LEQQKPEAAYFLPENGKRTGILIIDIQDASEIAAIVEPWVSCVKRSHRGYARHETRKPPKIGSRHRTSGESLR